MLGGIGRALSHRDYCLYWSSNGVTTIGRWMYRIAVGWLTWELTESTVWLGIVAFAETFPLVIFSVIAGALADRAGYLRITFLAQTATALVAVAFAAVTLTGWINIELVLLFTLLIGSLEALTTPARIALVHILVPKQDLAAAIGLQSATFNGCRFIGPAIASIIIAFAGSGAVLAVVAGTFIQFCFVITIIRADEPGRKPAPWRDLMREMGDGIRYSMDHVGIRFLFVMLGVTGFLIRPIIELMPAFSVEVFDSGSAGFGILVSSIGLGAMISCLWIGVRGQTTGLTRLVTHSLLVQGAVLILSTLTGYIWLAAALLAIVGFAMLVGGVGSQTLIQNAVEADVRARVISLFIVISWGTPAIGALIAGWVADFAGLAVTIATGGGVTLALWFWASRLVHVMERDLEASI